MMNLSEASSVMQGRLKGVDGHFLSVEIDTRRLEKGALYFAIHELPGLASQWFVAKLAMPEFRRIDTQKTYGIAIIQSNRISIDHPFNPNQARLIGAVGTGCQKQKPNKKGTANGCPL